MPAFDSGETNFFTSQICNAQYDTPFFSLKRISASTWRNINVIITPKTMSRRSFDAIMALLLWSYLTNLQTTDIPLSLQSRI